MLHSQKVDVPGSQLGLVTILLIANEQEMWLTRIFAIGLAISGIWLLPAAMMPLFWPGLLIWFGWIAIGLGVRWLNHPIFWLCCALWDGYWGILLFSDTDWSGINKAPGYFHVRYHAAASVLLSVTAIAILLYQFGRSEKNGEISQA